VALAVPGTAWELKFPCTLEACASVPSMGRILLDERSQPEPMTATVAKRKT